MWRILVAFHEGVKKMPDQACFMAAYGPFSSVDVMMAPAFMSSSEKWVILIENTLPYYHQQMGQFIWFWLEVWIVLVMILTEFMEHTSLLWKHFLDFWLYIHLILINTREKGKYMPNWIQNRNSFAKHDWMFAQSCQAGNEGKVSLWTFTCDSLLILCVCITAL